MTECIKRTDSKTHGNTDTHTDRQTDRHTDRHTDRVMNGWILRKTDNRQSNRWSDGCRDG